MNVPKLISSVLGRASSAVIRETCLAESLLVPYVRCVHVGFYFHSDLGKRKEFTLSPDELRTLYLLTENSQDKH